MTCPDWLSEGAREEWARLVTESVILVHPGNLALVVAYCQNFARWKETESILAQNGTEIVIRDDKGTVKTVLPSPQIGIGIKSLSMMIKAGTQLGIFNYKAQPCKKDL